jgi:hypothetical protein
MDSPREKKLVLLGKRVRFTSLLSHFVFWGNVCDIALVFRWGQLGHHYPNSTIVDPGRQGIQSEVPGVTAPGISGPVGFTLDGPFPSALHTTFSANRNVRTNSSTPALCSDRLASPDAYPMSGGRESGGRIVNAEG